MYKGMKVTLADLPPVIQEAKKQDYNKAVGIDYAECKNCILVFLIYLKKLNYLLAQKYVLLNMYYKYSNLLF